MIFFGGVKGGVHVGLPAWKKDKGDGEWRMEYEKGKRERGKGRKGKGEGKWIRKRG